MTTSNPFPPSNGSGLVRPRLLPQPTDGTPPAATSIPAPRASVPIVAPVTVKSPVAATAAPVVHKPAAGITKRKPAFIAKKADTGPSSESFLYDLLNDCGNTGVSDLHVHPGLGMWREVKGILKVYNAPENILTEEDILKWIEHADGYEDMKVDAPERLLDEKGHTTVAFDTGTWRVRGSFRKSTVGVSCTFRLIPSKIPTIEEFDIPQIMQSIARRKSGLILIEGPTGSGKTTSIAALMDMLNKSTDQHFYCIEDPIEFHHKPIGASIFTMREIGVHAVDYASAVENALRSKPNVIFVGEMLSNDTKKAALHAATTGHLVITTAHAGSVAEAIDSFIGGFSADEQAQIRSRLSQSLLAVMCQSLIPTKGGGQVAAREVMISNLNFAEIIANGDMKMLHGQMNSTPDSFTLEDDLVRLIEEGKIDAKIALERAKKPEVLKVELERKGLL